jgi:hypothetical protein
MTHKILIVILVLLSVATLILRITNRGRIFAYDINTAQLSIHYGARFAKYISPSPGILRIHLTRGGFSGVFVRMDIPLWIPLLAFGAYPIYAFIRMATQSWWLRQRKKKGLCIKCGYNLTGNVSGICPECGEPITKVVT